MTEVLFSLWEMPVTGIKIIEAVAVIAGLVYLFLQVKAKSAMWIFGIVMSLCYVYLNCRNHLYANMCLHIYYIGMSVYGLLVWMGVITKKGKAQVQQIQSFPAKGILPLVIVWISVAAFLVWILGYLGETRTPWMDGATSALSVIAMWMLARKYYQEWICWIICNPINVVMFAMADMWPTAFMYVIYLIVGVVGFFQWRKEYLRSISKQSSNHDKL